MLDRRRFILLSAGLAARGLVGDRAWAAPASAGTAEALAIAKRQIIATCATLGFPNGAIHAVRALGRSCPLGVGDAYKLLLESFLVANPIRDHIVLEIPVQKEGHRNAMLKTLLERGDCERGLAFELQGHPYTFGDYIESARSLVAYPGEVAIDEHSWTIMAMALTTTPDRARWTNIWGANVDLGRMIEDTSKALATDTAPLAAWDPASKSPPESYPALARACGGLHMVYALAVALGAGHGSPAVRAAFPNHMRTLQKRLDHDMRLIDLVERENTKLAGAEAALGVAYDARVKLLGHALETAGVAEKQRLVAFSGADRRAWQDARTRLCEVLVAGRDLVFERYKRDTYLYESMTTNICHAYNGLTHWPT